MLEKDIIPIHEPTQGHEIIEAPKKEEEPIVANSYAEKLNNVLQKDKEEREFISKQSELESAISECYGLEQKINEYLKDHPRSDELITSMNDINSAGYNVHDKKLHLYFLATKISLSKEDIPSSLHRHFDIVDSAKRLTPAIRDSLEKLKAFTENTMEQYIKKRDKRALTEKFNSNFGGNSFGANSYYVDGGHINFKKATYDYICGRINKDTFINLKEETKQKYSNYKQKYLRNGLKDNFI